MTAANLASGIGILIMMNVITILLMMKVAALIMKSRKLVAELNAATAEIDIKIQRLEYLRVQVLEMADRHGLEIGNGLLRVILH
jgi:hypothetical protein